MSDEKIDSALVERLRSAGPHDVFDVDIFLRSEPAREVAAEMRAADAETHVADAELIAARAYRTQDDLVAFLENRNASIAFADDGFERPAAEVTARFWSTNSVAANVTREVLGELMGREDVLAIQPARYASLEELKDDGPKEDAAPAPVATNASVVAWSVTKINAPLLWARGIAGTDVVVAVIDTGVNYLHDDLKSRMWTSANPSFPKHGYDFSNNDDDPIDEDGHGTACAGIVAGDGTSGEATGVAPGARIMAVRVGGAERQFWAGMEFAMRQRAQVISMSMTWKFPSRPNYPGWRRVCESLFAAGIVHANSIGNQGAEPVAYPIPFNIGAPGNCPPPRLHPSSPIVGGMSSAVGCGATDSSDALSGSSGRGPVEWNAGPYTDYPFNGGTQPGLLKPDVCAPGPGTRSCNWRFRIDAKAKPYTGFGGTSAATPHVAGCMALLVHATQRAGLTPNPARILEALEETAVKITGQTKAKENHFGAGRVDVYAAYQYGAKRGWWT
jgi:subtilisin family serine protease